MTAGPATSAARLSQVDALPAPIQAPVTRILDEITRPLSIREIEGALRASGVAKSQRAILGRVLAQLSVIVIAPGEARK